MSTTELDPLSFKEPAGLRPLLSGYVTEVLRYQPDDIVAFSKDYFTAMSNGQLHDFLAHQGASLNANLKTLQDYANVSQPARAPSHEAEDPTEREIRELQALSGGIRSYGSNGPAAAASPSHGSMLQSHYADIPAGQSLEEAEGEAQRHSGRPAAEDDAEDEEMLALQERLRQMEASGQM